MGCGISGEPKFVYSKEDITEKEIQNSSPVYINPNIESFEQIQKRYNIQTYTEKLLEAFKNFALKGCLGYRKILSNNELADKFTFFSYEEVQIMCENFSYNLRRYNLIEEKEFDGEGNMKFMGIYSRNCVEWIVSDIGCQLDSITVVTLYNTLGDVAFEHIFKQTKLSTVCISPENIKNILKYKEKYNLNLIKNIILFDMTVSTYQASDQEQLEKAGLRVFRFSDMIKEVTKQERLQIKLTLPGPESIITISYTSGTTNLPKGVKISQRSLNAQMVSVSAAGILITELDVHLSYLPLAHIMERVSVSLILALGGSIGCLSFGDLKKVLVEDLQILHPSFFFAVPKVLSNFRENILTKISTTTGCKRSIVEKALRTKREKFASNTDISDAFYDTFVLSKIIDQFGGKWRFIITGSAPLSIELGIDIKIIFGCPIIEAYGMTETGGAITCTNFHDLTNGHVGGPIITAKIRLNDCEELNYTSKTRTDDKITPCGEICVKGPVCFSGYFADKENTDKMFDKDGWLHTGDIAMLSTDQKKFKIIDRLKEIFKLVQGEYIAPGKLESAYSKAEYVSQICIYGESLKTYIIAIITPKKEDISKYLRDKDWFKENENIEDYYERQELLDEIKKSLDKVAASYGFNSLEKVQKIIISKEEFTVENQLLTPTAKVVRRKIANKFKEQIEKIYV